MGEDAPNEYTDWAKALRHGAVANCVNMRRVIRDLIEPKVVDLSECLEKVEGLLSRIDNALVHSRPDLTK